MKTSSFWLKILLTGCFAIFIGFVQPVSAQTPVPPARAILRLLILVDHSNSMSGDRNQTPQVLPNDLRGYRFETAISLLSNLKR